jgi:hypothetical protein
VKEKLKMKPENTFDSVAYAEYLQMAKEDQVHIVHSFNPDHPKGGYTLAWQRDNPFSVRGKMIRVSVTFCSDKDHYTRKVGAFQALENFYKGASILLPVGSPNSEYIVTVLRTFFEYSLNAYYSE